MEASCHTTVTAKTVELLKKKVKQGTNGVIDELKTYHGITATYEDKGKILTLHGDDDDILELAVYMLEKRAGVTSKNSKKELGGESTVKWTFTGREAVNIKRLFEVKTNNLEKNCNATVSKPKAAVETVIITCPYKSHTVVEKEIKHIEEALNKCLQVSVPISGPNHNQLAKQFAQKENDTFYCEYEKDQLIIWGKTQQNCDNGLEEWRNELDLLKPTKGAEDDNPTMSEKDNDNVTQQAPITNNGVKDNEANLPDNDSLGRKSPRAPVGEDVHKVAGTSAMDIDKREVGKTIGSRKAKKYSFNVNGLNVYVYNTSITDMNGMDAITNAANEHMMHGGGVAYYISKAAGSKMDDDCKNYIKQHSKIPVTENYVSIPGKLKCKGIIHAVGPIWGDYSDKAKCAFELQSTILKVLEATRSKSWRKVAIPAISSGIFGVPKQLCAEMYVKSFIEYGHIFGDVVEVHFVDVNQEILDLVVKAHSNWANKTLTLEWDNAWKYVKTQSLTQRQGTQGSSEHSPDKPKLRFIGEQHTSYGERMFKYSVGDKLALRVYCGDLTKLKSVNVVAVPITNTEGGLMKVFEQLLQKTTYSSFVDRNCKGSTEGSVHVFEASKDLPDIANIVLKQKPMDMKTLSYAFKNLFKYKYKGQFVSLAVPLIGLGHIDTKRQSSVDELCECIINSILDVAGEKLSIREIHLVNKERGATDSIQTVLKRRTLSAAGHDKANSITQPHHKHAQQQQQQQQYNTHYPDVKWNKHEPVDVKNYNTNSYAVPKGANCINHATREAVASLDCAKHYVCKVCQPIHNDGNCLTCKSGSLKDNKGSTSSNCPICQDVPKQPKSLPCKHVFCTDCYEEMIKHKPQCPICGYIVGIITGTQPPGDMFYGVDKRYHLPGFEKEKFGSILIRYKFPDGNQQKHHPKPGTSYKGIERVAYLPNNKEGNDVLQLLRIAFDRKLIFTIGDSTTTGKTGVITWNDIHHKTRPDGGPENFGYPDSTYPQRVREELTAKGVTLPTSGNKLYPDLSAMSGYGK